ncbi:MAG: spore coat associated protein CotJA [Tissierellia bacterium]|nr:spore coat associated protein CotJA [Tissierellia bacterium]
MNGNHYDRSRNMLLARAYVPFQRLNQIYSPSEALRKGTLFPELYMPYDEKTREVVGGGYYG